MKVKLSQVLDADQALKRLVEVKLPSKAAWRVAVITGKLNPMLAAFEATRREIAIKCGASEGNPVPRERMAEFVEELNALVAEEEEVEFIKLRLSDLGDALITPADLMALEFLIDGET